MKGLKKIALCSAVALAPFAANADLKALDDSAMSSVTGQAGVTIDLSANVQVGEIAYKDGGFLAMSGVALGGAGIIDPNFGGTALDDIRLTIDVAGTAGGDLGVSAQADAYLTGAVANQGGTYAGVNSTDVTVNDGDLVIALRSQSGTPVDFGLAIGEISLNAEANAGDLGSFATSANKGTVLVSNLGIAGAIGPIDIVVDAQSDNMNINAYFNAAGQLTMPFMNTTLGFRLHNERGSSVAVVEDGNGNSTSFAHAQVNITPSTNGLGVDVQDFSGDLDLTNITFGSSPSIGQVFMTDLAVTAQMDIYGH